MSPHPTRRGPRLVEIDSIDALHEHLARTGSLAHTVLNGLDLRPVAAALDGVDVTGAVLLGGLADDAFVARCQRSGALVFPEFRDLPFRPWRGALYDAAELFSGYVPDRPETLDDAFDTRVYRWWQGCDDVVGLLAQRIHDHAIDDALADLLTVDGRRARVVAVMGGHGMRRDDAAYGEVARLARALTRAGHVCASGGGPGAMEATNLGGWFGARPAAELEAALDLLGTTPEYRPVPTWLDAAFAVRERWPLPPGEIGSIGVPTWHYGHEPPNVFATHIAKYFANSIREDGLLAIALAGVVFAPGSAGTVQEIFQDACQNHYETHGVVSPMVFLGVDHWTVDKPVYPLLRRLADGRPYASGIAIGDHPAEVLAALGVDASHLG